jgi:hypothetical protein
MAELPLNPEAKKRAKFRHQCVDLLTLVEDNKPSFARFSRRIYGVEYNASNLIICYSTEFCYRYSDTPNPGADRRDGSSPSQCAVDPILGCGFCV